MDAKKKNADILFFEFHQQNVGKENTICNNHDEQSNSELFFSCSDLIII